MRIVSCVILAVIVGTVASLRADEDPSTNSTPPTVEQRDAVNGELIDVARALRSIDQSFSYRGMRGTGSWTAGSAHMDWHAQGIRPEDRWEVKPPPEYDLSGYSQCCPQCGTRRRCGVRHECRSAVDTIGCQPCPPSQWGSLPVDSIRLMVHRPCHWTPEIVGQVHTDEQGIALAAGSVILRDAAAQLIHDARHANSIRLAVRVLIHDRTESFTPIVTLGEQWHSSNLCLGQVGHELRLRLRTSQSDTFHSLDHEISLGHFPNGAHAIDATYCHERLTLNINGVTTQIEGITGGFSNWESGALYLGDPTGQTRWHGRLDMLELGCTRCAECCR